MKKTLILTLLTILFAIDCNAQSLKDLLQQCNKASQQTASAYYESEIETSINQKKRKYTQKVCFKRGKFKSRLAMFNLEQQYAFQTCLKQVYDQNTFTHIDTEASVAEQYEQEDKDIFLKKIDFTTIHPYIITDKPFDIKDKKKTISLLDDTTINNKACKRFCIVSKPEQKQQLSETYIIDAGTFYPLAKQSTLITTYDDSHADTLQSNITFTKFTPDAAFSLSRFQLTKDETPGNIKYMSRSALKKQWEKQEIEQSTFAYGKTAETFIIQNYDGETINTRQIHDKVLLIAFYYNNCPPCMDMLDDLERLYRNYKDKGLEIIAINPIDKQQSNFELRRFAELKKLSFNLCSAKRRTIEESYLVYSYPTIFIIDKRGKICFSHQGYNALFTSEVEKVLKRKL